MALLIRAHVYVRSLPDTYVYVCMYTRVCMREARLSLSCVCVCIGLRAICGKASRACALKEPRVVCVRVKEYVRHVMRVARHVRSAYRREIGPVWMGFPRFLRVFYEFFYWYGNSMSQL